jgi:CBS domain containing-hemolysin-like protein
MTADIWQLGSAALLVVLAGLFSAADAALGGFSRARAEELKAEGRPGAVRLVKLLDDPARYLNTALLMRLLCEISAIVLVATWAGDAYQGSPVPTFLTTIGVMLVVSFVVIGVAPRTIGRQHDVRVALA